MTPPPKNPPAPLPPPAMNDDWSFSWINKDPGSLLGWSAGYVEVTQIRRKSASSGQLSFSLAGENAKQPDGILFCKVSACEDWALIVDEDVPLKCWRKKSQGLPRREGHVDAVNSTMICSRLAFVSSAQDISLHLPETDMKIITNVSK